MPVFVSYRRVDEARARSIHRKLGEFGIDTYIDVLDPLLTDPEEALDKIVPQIIRCTHLLAVVGSETLSSPWVPFEIGVATNAEKRITSFQHSSISLPEFLRIWPVLTQESELALFAVRYFQDAATLQKSTTLSEARTKNISSARQFHRLLKADLRQGGAR